MLGDLEKPCRLAVVVPVYGNEGSLEILYERIVAAAGKANVDLTLQFVNDRSPDRSQDVLERLAARDPRVRVLLLSRNHGSFTAIAAGLSETVGHDAAVILSADLQDPPELIPEMVARWRRGRRVVLAARRKRSDPLVSRVLSAGFHWLFRKIAFKDMPPGGFDFCLIDRLVVSVILESSEKKTSLVGLILWAGFDRDVLRYDRMERAHGRSMWSMGKKLSYAFNSIAAFSSLPLRMFILLGLSMAVLSMAGGVYVAVAALAGTVSVPGWPSLMLLQLSIGSMLFLGLGILGGYLWNNLEQTRKRPLFIVDKRIGAFYGPGSGEDLLVPFFDLPRVSSAVKASLAESACRVLGARQVILAEETARFEREFAAYAGAAHVVGVSSGADALTLALWAAGLMPGDKVAVPALTAPATATAVLLAGGVPVFTDVDPQTLLMTPQTLEAAIEKGVRAAIPVHLYGNPCDMPAIASLCEKNGLILVEDCAQAVGTGIGGRHCGLFGAAGAVSFYPTKNLGAYGDAGAVLTGDPETAERLRRMRFYGQDAAGECVMQGMNGRLDELQAALLLERMKILGEQNRERQAIAAAYNKELTFLRPVPSLPGRVPHLYVVRPENREDFLSFLSGKGVGAGVHYSLPLNRHAYLAARSETLPCPAAEEACARVVSLPCFPGMRPEEIHRVIAACQSWREV